MDAASETPLQVLLVAERRPDWASAPCAAPPAAPPLAFSLASHADAARTCDAVIFEAADGQDVEQLLRRPDLRQAAFDTAVLVIAPTADIDSQLAFMRLGVQEVLPHAESAGLQRALRHAVERKRREQASHRAYATDLATGLPHEAQLLEHISQLVALRERDPAPMVLMVLRIEGLASTAARLGAEAANILRRKVAVRLRSGLRASDVVAATGPESFGVLLGHIEAASDGPRVAAKAVRALQQPFQVAGQSCAVAVAVGLALYPSEGKDAAALLQRASAQAGLATASGREGFSTHSERGPALAANDEAAETRF